MQILAPAKINLSLRILNRRPDGFHEIETLISPISLYDKIDIEKQSRWIDFSCNDPSIPRGDDNLVVRAAKRFLEATKVKGGVAIALKKKIPHGAGLGGGSSDAASTLLALNEVFETKLPREALAKIAESIGSDVPFFISQSPAICRGRGELVTPIELRERLRTASRAPIISGLSIVPNAQRIHVFRPLGVSAPSRTIFRIPAKPSLGIIPSSSIFGGFMID